MVSKLKYKGGILLYAVFISFIISIFCSAIILMMYYSNFTVERFLLMESLKDEATSALNYTLINSHSLEKNKNLTISIFNKSFQTFIRKGEWGAFNTLTVCSKYRNDSIYRIALIGSWIKESERLSLYLSDPTQNLSISGHVELIGPCYIPKAIIKKTNIEGRSLEKEVVAYNLAKSSSSVLPEINKDIFEPIKFYLKNKSDSRNSLSADSYLQNDTISNSFSNPTLCLFSYRGLSLTNKIMKGNIILMSEREITINNGCELSDVILISPKIRITATVKNAFQAYALKEIIVEEKVSLDYPSSLIVYGGTDNHKESSITIKSKSIVSGCIILYDMSNSNSIVKISEESVVNGLIYSSTLVEHRGKVHGSVYSSKLSYSTKSASYDNLLMDAEINVSKLSEYYIAPNCMLNYDNKAVIKWLN